MIERYYADQYRFSMDQAISQKSAMGMGEWCYGDLRPEPPAHEHFVFFGKNNLILGLF